MAQNTTQQFSYKRGVISLLVAYAGVSTLGFGLYALVSRSMGTSPWAQVDLSANAAYNLTEKWLPLINLAAWTLCARIYFKDRAAQRNDALRLGAFWLFLAALLDLVVFVLIQHPLSVDAKGFYIDQSPWIYLTYAAVFVAPLCYVALARRRK